MGRVYDTARWQVLRQLKLSTAPLCEPCERRGRIEQASHVDHIQSMAAGGDPYPDLEGLMSMCAPCHSIKTNAKDRAGGKGVAYKGCDADGTPLDPAHPFLNRSEGQPPPYPIEGREAFASRPVGNLQPQLVPSRDWGF